MNFSLMLRYFTELAMIIPAAAIAIIPVYRFRRVNKPFLFCSLAILLSFFTIGGAALCSIMRIPTNTLLFPSMATLFIIYHFCFELSVFKKYLRLQILYSCAALLPPTTHFSPRPLN